MKREEAILLLHDMKDTYDEIHENTNYEIGYEQMTALDMAIEALSQPIVAKHFDIQSGYIYCSPQIAENVKVVVRCKDCIHWKADNEVFEMGFCCVFPQKWVAETFFCADGERREK